MGFDDSVPTAQFIDWRPTLLNDLGADEPTPPSAEDAPRPRRVAVDKKAFAPLDDAILKPRRWQLIVRGGWRFGSPINLLEARAEIFGFRRAARCAWLHGARVLLLGDNLAAVLSYDKGRARHWALRGFCRTSAALQLGTELRWAQPDVETSRNPMDRDSRAADRGEVAPGAVQKGHSRAIRDLERVAFSSRSSDPPDGRLASQPAGRYRRAFLEIFAGDAMLSSAVAHAGLSIASPIDTKIRPNFDIGAHRCRRHIVKWIREKRLWAVHLAPPEIAWTARCASASAGARARGARLAGWITSIIRECEKSGTWWSLPQPRWRGATRRWDTPFVSSRLLKSVSISAHSDARPLGPSLCCAAPSYACVLPPLLISLARITRGLPRDSPKPLSV